MASTAAKLAVGSGAGAAAAGGGAIYLTSGNSNTSSISVEKEPQNEKPQSKEHIDIPKIKAPVESKTIKKTPLPQITTFRTSKAGYGSNLEDTILDRYWLYLLDSDNKDNEHYWNDKYTKLSTTQETDLDQNFKGIKKGYSDSDETSLNKVCSKVYKQADPYFNKSTYLVGKEFSIVESADKLPLIKNLWSFCSLLDEKPKNLVEANEAEKSNSDIIKHESYYAKYLIATKTEQNNKFWEIKEDWYKKQESDNETHKKFVEFVTSKNLNNKTLREMCENLYGMKHQSETSSTRNENISLVLKYCSYLDYPFDKWFASSTIGR